ncbi:hypothetical protein [Streptomyces sp. NPDC053048]|uniref:hypothetical protein n=1 Tax=Streptomyces sp. NPDC053048 TaxID=3365694 RepID=UPI0037D78D25
MNKPRLLLRLETWWWMDGCHSWPLRLVSRTARRKHAEAERIADNVRSEIFGLLLNQAILNAMDDVENGNRSGVPIRWP